MRQEEKPVSNGFDHYALKAMAALDQVANWPVGSAAVGVLVKNPSGQPTGYARCGDYNALYEWASITKILTTLAVLVAVEEGTLSLETPCGPPGSTIAHLLSHASGIAPSGNQAIAPAGTKRIYSNAGFELLGAQLSVAANMPFSRYLEEAVLVPLGMTTVTLDASGSPASGAMGALSDLMKLGAELLVPRLLAPATLAKATSVSFAGLEGVLPGFGMMTPCDWGLGFELKDSKWPHWTGARCSSSTFGHFGQSGGFLWVDPEASVVCGGLSDTSFGPWAQSAWPQLSDAVLDEVAAR